MSVAGSQLAVAYELIHQHPAWAWLITPQGGSKRVKNLGYVLQNQKRIHSVAWVFVDRWSGILLVRFVDHSLFATHYASWQVAHERFFHRPIFEGIRVAVYDRDEKSLGYFVSGKSLRRADLSHLKVTDVTLIAG